MAVRRPGWFLCREVTKSCRFDDEKHVCDRLLSRRRPLSCPLSSPSWRSSGSLWSPWSRRTSAQRSRTSDCTSPGTSSSTSRWARPAAASLHRLTGSADCSFCLQKHFYGPVRRRMGGLGFIRLGVWQNFLRAWRSGYQGNMNGEGFVLGGVFVIGAGDQVTRPVGVWTGVLARFCSVSNPHVVFAGGPAGTSWKGVWPQGGPCRGSGGGQKNCTPQISHISEQPCTRTTY